MVPVLGNVNLNSSCFTKMLEKMFYLFKGVASFPDIRRPVSKLFVFGKVWARKITEFPFFLCENQQSLENLEKRRDLWKMQDGNRIRVRDFADMQAPIEALAKVVRSRKDLRQFQRRKHSAKVEEQSNLNQMKIDSYFESFPKSFQVLTEVNVLPPVPSRNTQSSKLGMSLQFLKTKAAKSIPPKPTCKRPFGAINGNTPTSSMSAMVLTA